MLQLWSKRKQIPDLSVNQQTFKYLPNGKHWRTPRIFQEDDTPPDPTVCLGREVKHIAGNRDSVFLCAQGNIKYSACSNKGDICSGLEKSGKISWRNQNWVFEERGDSDIW